MMTASTPIWNASTTSSKT